MPNQHLLPLLHPLILPQLPLPRTQLPQRPLQLLPPLLLTPLQPLHPPNRRIHLPPRQKHHIHRPPTRLRLSHPVPQIHPQEKHTFRQHGDRARVEVRHPEISLERDVEVEPRRPRGREERGEI